MMRARKRCDSLMVQGVKSGMVVCNVQFSMTFSMTAMVMMTVKSTVPLVMVGHVICHLDNFLRLPKLC